MTEEEIIKKYKEEQEKKQLIAKHSYLSKNADTSHREYLHSTHETPRSTEAQKADTVLAGTTDLDRARWEQAQRGETSFAGATGDSMLVDNEGNFIKSTSPFDRANTNSLYEYATPQETAKYITENKAPVGNTVVDYNYAKKVLDSDLAWSDYLETGTLASKKKAQELDTDLKNYEDKVGYMAGNMPYISTNVQQIPQQLYYLQENALAAVPAAVVGGAVKATSKNSKAAAIAAKVTYDLASKATSFDATKKMTQGSLYRELINMGIPEDTAKYYAKDSAVQQAWVETGSGVMQDFVEWLIGYTVGGTVPGKIAKSVLGSKFADVLIESTEELIQEGQSISAEKNALKASGMDSSMYTPEYEAQRKGEAFTSAIPITLGVAGIGGTASQVATTVIVDQKNIQSIKNNYKKSINNLEQQNADLQAKIDEGSLSGKEKYTANKQIKDNNKQIKVLQEASSDENVKNEYQTYKEFQKALQESQELRDSTKLVETEYADGTNETIERAQANARKSFGSDGIYIEAEPNITQAEKNLKDVIEKRTGKNVVYYTTFGVDNLGTIRGFVEDNNTIYIEAGRSAKDTIASAIHEYGHILANENPTLFEAFKNLAKNKFGEELDNKIAEANKQTGTFNLKDGQQLTDLQKNFILEEMFGDQLAEIASKPKNVKALENSTLSVFDKIKDVAKSVASEVTGVENTNQRISGYDYSGVSYANGDILQDESFEKQVMETLKSLKNVDEPKDTGKGTKAPKTDKEKAYARIEEKYKKMKGGKSPEAIKKMIADELNLKYNGPKDNSSDANEVRRVYQDLKDHSGTLFSARKGFKGKLHTLKYGDLASALNTDTPNMKKGIHEKPFKNSIYTIIKYGFDDYDILSQQPINKKALSKDREVYRNERERNTYTNDGKSRSRRRNDNISSANIGEQSREDNKNARTSEERKENPNKRRVVSDESNGNNGDRSSDSRIKYSRRVPGDDGPNITNEGTVIPWTLVKWANRSQARDEDDGRLVEYYHGSPFAKDDNFDQFKPRYRHNGAALGDGYYLTRNYNRALNYTDMENTEGENADEYVKTFIVNTLNPLDISQPERVKAQILRNFDSMIETFNPGFGGGNEVFGRWGRVPYTEDMKEMLEDSGDGDEWFKSFVEYYVPELAKVNYTNEYGVEETETIDTREIYKYLGFDSIMDYSDIVIFESNQAKYLDNANPSTDSRFAYSMRKGESNTEKIINNQRNELTKQQDKAERLEAENKGLKKINKGIKSTGRTRIRELKRESDKMLKVGRETELKLKGQLEREGKKYNKLSELAVDLKYETQLDRKAQTDGIKYGREYKDLFIGLRREGKSITEAYNFTKEIYEASQELNNSIDSSMKILNDIRKKKVYNKLPKELKAKIDSYEQIWTGSRKQTDLMLARRILDSATAKEYLGKVALSKGVRNKIMSLEGDDFDGKGTISLETLFNGSIGLAKSFEQGLIDLQNEIEEFQSANKQKERTIELGDDIADIQVAVEDEKQKQSKLKTTQFKKGFTNKTIGNTLMTLKTEIQALMGGNIHTPVMKIQDNLQKGETRKKQSITEVYRILNTFMEKSKGINRALGTQTWNKALENSLSNKSKFIDTGMSATGDNGKSVDIKLPRHMMMSLAMHLANDDNMLHISGGIVGISTDENGNTRISPIKGMGVRIPDETLYRRGQIKDAYDAGVTVKLTQEQVEKIVDMLTPEELAFVDATKEVFKYTTSLINEVSNRIVGYDMATVENYFPIRVWDKGESSGAVMNAPFQKRYGDALAYMLSPGWLQERTTSTNPIYLENIADVMNRVVNNVTNFYGYAEALRDNHIILDSTMGNGTELKKSIGNLSSSFMPNYTRLTRFITGQESLRDGRFRGLMAMNTLTFNVGTWLTQPMSFFNAMKYFSTKEFMTSINPLNNNVKLNNMIRDYFNELGIDSNEYSDYELARAFIAMATPSLDYRAIGYKTPEINQLFNKSLQQKIGAHGIQAFDDIAVTALARMMAYSVSLDENIEFGSEKYFEELGNRLTQVLAETQPEYSQVNRANMFRSTNGIVRMLSLFGTPANQMFNNFMQSAMQVRYEAREGKASKEAKISLAKSISGIVVSSVMVGLVRALRDSIRDDEDDESFASRWTAQTIVALLGPTLILDDIAQFIMSTAKFGGMNSYDFNTPETTFMNGITNLAEKLMQLGKEDVSATKKTTDIIKAIGVITPIDTKSVIRVVEAIMKFVAPDLYQSYALQNSSSAYKAWLKNTDTPMSEFYRAYTATRQGELDKLGYHKADKSKGIESNLKETRKKALQQVFDSEADVNKYMGILFNYKT